LLTDTKSRRARNLFIKSAKRLSRDGNQDIAGNIMLTSIPQSPQTRTTSEQNSPEYPTSTSLFPTSIPSPSTTPPSSTTNQSKKSLNPFSSFKVTPTQSPTTKEEEASFDTSFHPRLMLSEKDKNSNASIREYVTSIKVLKTNKSLKLYHQQEIEEEEKNISPSSNVDKSSSSGRSKTVSFFKKVLLQSKILGSTNTNNNNNNEFSDVSDSDSSSSDDDDGGGGDDDIKNKQKQLEEEEEMERRKRNRTFSDEYSSDDGDGSNKDSIYAKRINLKCPMSPDDLEFSNRFPRGNCRFAAGYTIPKPFVASLYSMAYYTPGFLELIEALLNPSEYDQQSIPWLFMVKYK